MKGQKNRKTKGQKLGLVVGILIFIVGLGFVLYPHIMQVAYNQGARIIIGDFDEKYPTEEVDPLIEELYQALVKYNENLYETGQAALSDPFAYEQEGFDLTPYGIEDNVIGHLNIPALDLDIPIYLGASKENMKLGAALLTQTSMPIGGENTNAVIAAHRGYSKAKMFREIEVIQVGDEIYIRNFREELTYVVTGVEVIRPTEIDKVLIQPGKDMITLLTCHPYRQSTHRYLVYAERVK